MKPLRIILLLAFLTFALPAAFPTSALLPVSAVAAAAEKKEEEPPKRAFEPEQLSKITAWAKDTNSKGWRKGAGGYFSVIKLSIMLVLFFGWVATTSWTNNDTQKVVEIFRYRWNALSLIVFPVCFLIALMIPFFWFAGLPILLLGWLVPLFAYVHHRNGLDGMLKSDKVLTGDHLSFFFKEKMHMNVDPKQAAYETGSPIQLIGWGKHTTKEMQNGRGVVARNQAGYNHVREMIYQAIERNAVCVRIVKSPGECRFFFQLDGVWHQINDLFDQPKRKHIELSSEEAESIFTTFRILAGLRTTSAPSRQSGECLAQYDRKKKLVINVVLQSKQGLEEIMLQFQFAALPFHRLEELGMYPDRAQNVKNMLNSERGMFILSAPPGQGLRTMTNVAFDTADRFTRDFVTVEDVNNPGMVIENIQLNTYDSSKGESPMTVLPDVFFKEPKVLLLRDMVNLETMKLCCEEVAKDRLIITTFRGRDSVDTILRMLKTGINPKLFAESLSFVLTQRLVRRLCPDCKEEIPASTQIIRQLHLPVTTEVLYRQRVHQSPEPGQKDTYVPCPRCREIGYIGRAGIYDGILINDEIRHIIMTNPTESALRQAAIRSGNHSFLYDGAKLVADGTTSYEELVRAMKG